MAGDTKNRLRLALRAEQAFGLKSLPVGRTTVLAHDVAFSVCADETDRPSAPEPVARVVRPTEMTEPKPGVLFAPDPAAPAFDAPTLSREDKRRRLVALDENEVRGCR